MEKIEKIIGEINASMAMEGMPLTDEDKDRMRKCYSDTITYKSMRKILVEKHTVKS